MGAPRLSINQFGVDHLPMADMAGTAAEAGFTGIGLSMRAVRQLGASRVTAVLRDAGLTPTSLCVARATLSTGSAGVLRDLAAVLDDAELAGELGAPLVVMLGHERGAGPGELADLAAALRTLSRHPRCRTPLQIEPVNPVLTWMSCINSLRDARDVLTAVPSLQLVLDIWHSWRDPELADLLPELIGRCSIVHVSDYRYHSSDPLARDYPGAGQIDFAHFGALLRQGGFSGWWEAEVLLPQRPAIGDLAGYVRRCRDTLAVAYRAGQPTGVDIETRR
jgi:sugar phosphate isomerase/epimerase